LPQRRRTAGAVPRGALERQTGRNAPRDAENCVGQSARVGRGPAEFTSAGRGGACRPDETRLERRAASRRSGSRRPSSTPTRLAVLVAGSLRSREDTSQKVARNGRGLRRLLEEE